MVSDVEHLTMYLLVMCTSCLGKHLFHLFACFFNQIMMICVCVCVFVLGLYVFLIYILDTNPLSDRWFANPFSHSKISVMQDEYVLKT